MKNAYVVEVTKYKEDGSREKTKLIFEVFQGKIYDVQELKE